MNLLLNKLHSLLGINCHLPLSGKLVRVASCPTCFPPPTTTTIADLLLSHPPPLPSSCQDDAMSIAVDLDLFQNGPLETVELMAIMKREMKCCTVWKFPILHIYCRPPFLLMSE